MATKQLSFLNRYLSLWIFLAMGLGVALGHFFPALSTWLEELGQDGVNLPLAIGLILMMYPPLAKVRYPQLPRVFRDLRALGLSLFLNWILGPFLMFALALIFLADEPGYQVGLILIGLARCIAMVLVWNDLAEGSPEYGAGLVALNSLFQVFTYPIYAWLFITYLPPLFGYPGALIDIPFLLVVKSVAIYLGIPFLLGLLSRPVISRLKSAHWFEQEYLPAVAPLSLLALLFTIVLMFSLKGALVVALPQEVLKVALPLLIYFGGMFFLGFIISKLMGLPYQKNAAISFTAAGNNFELAIAVAIALFGLSSDQAFAGVIGPLVEVPVLIVLVRVAFGLRKRFYSSTGRSNHSSSP